MVSVQDRMPCSSKPSSHHPLFSCDPFTADEGHEHGVLRALLEVRLAGAKDEAADDTSDACRISSDES